MYDISVGLPFYAIYLRGFNTFSWAYKNPSLRIISITSNKIKINNHNTLCRPSEKVVISSRTFHSLVTSHYKTNCYELCGRVVSVKLYEMANQQFSGNTSSAGVIVGYQQVIRAFFSSPELVMISGQRISKSELQGLNSKRLFIHFCSSTSRIVSSKLLLTRIKNQAKEKKANKEEKKVK